MDATRISIVLLILSLTACATAPTAPPSSLDEIKFQQARRLKAVCFRQQVEHMPYGTASKLHEDCWRWARDAAGVR